MSIKVTDLHKSYGTRKVLDGINLDIGKQIFTLLGPNGAGKTTLVNAICGLEKYDSGSISVCGFDPQTQTQEVRRRIGLVTQDTSIYDYLTARENLTFHAHFYGIAKSDVKRKVNEALALSQLESRANDLAGTFSGGMKRRLALVRALLHDPEVIILDEPTLGVDVQNRNEIWNRILQMRGVRTVFINTNYMDEADSLSDLCAVIDGGRIVAMDTPENLKTGFSDGVRLAAEIVMDPVGLPVLKSELVHRFPEATVTPETAEGRCRVEIPAKMKANVLLTRVTGLFNATPGLTITDLQVRVPTLDDVFLNITGKKLRD